jgi:large subunit ribosomal protein L20
MAGLSYSVFMHKIHQAGVSLDRKQLSEIAVNDDAAFEKLVEIAKKQK